jgi:hypothetical protein
VIKIVLFLSKNLGQKMEKIKNFLFQVNYKDMIGKVLSEPNLNLINTPEYIVKSVLKLVENEIKTSLENL